MKLSNKQIAIIIWTVAGVLLLVNLFRLVAIIGPPIMIALIVDANNSLTYNGIVNGFHVYLGELSTSLELSEKTIKYILLYSFVSSLLLVILSPFLGLRKNIARNIVLFVVAIQISVGISQTMYTGQFPSWDMLLVNIALFTTLLVPFIAKNYHITKESHGRNAG